MSRYELIPEWHPHEACWMAWPVADGVFGALVDDARKAYAEVANAIATFEPVRMIASGDEIMQAKRLCGADVEIIDMPHADSWTRDTGPLFVRDEDGGLVAIDFRFNGWGQGIDPGEDVHMARRIAGHAGRPVHSLDFVMEGGGLHHDGAGLVYTTDSVLRHETRNPGLSLEAATRLISDTALDIQHVIAAPRGLVDDETNGHIDNLLTFADEDTALVQMPEDTSDPNHGICSQMVDSLLKGNAYRSHSSRYTIIQLPMTPPMFRHDGTRLTTSYTNLYIANGGIIVPRFGASTDEQAHAMIREVFPAHQFVAIDALPILQGGGGIHCITLQQPRP